MGYAVFDHGCVEKTGSNQKNGIGAIGEIMLLRHNSSIVKLLECNSRDSKATICRQLLENVQVAYSSEKSETDIDPINF